MPIEDDRQKIMSLWYNIESKIKGDLANLWEDRKELGELEARIEALEPKVIKLLEVIPTLKRHSHEYHARTGDLIKLLHHFSKYEINEWIQKVTSDLDYLSSEINLARGEAHRVLQIRGHVKETTPKDDFAKLANESYKSLLANKPSRLNPFYLQINPKSYAGGELAELVGISYLLDETNNSSAAFIGFYVQDNSYGFLFPNPKIEYTEGMSLIFQKLTRNNARFEKEKIVSVRIQQTDSRLWKVIDAIG
ncbi:hypothetical protein J4480_03270 [Candidatus Woesearchaeota archaeon]|nr:hypothetical protein [Candidatus Woesearchaeota archaeon]